MAQASRDQNRIPTLLAVSSADGVTPVTLYADPTTHRLYVDLAGGSGTVTTVSMVSANGFAGTVATATTTPAITLSTTVTGLLKGNGTAISAATSGTDYSAGTSGLTTGILKSTTTTGVLTIAVAGDFPTLNQNTTGSAATLTTPRAIYGNNFDGSAALTQIINSTYGGTGNGFTKFTGPTTAEKTFTLPDASSTIVVQGGALGTPSSGTVTNLTGTASININGTVGATTPAAGTFTTVTTSGNIELGNASDTTLARSSAGTMTLEGVRVQTTSPLVVSASSYTTDTGTSLNMDNLDVFVITAQAGALLFNAPGGTLVQGRNLIIRIKDDGTARALTWNAVFRAMGTALPSTTVLSKTLYLGFKYNSTDTKWDLIASAQEA